jgi:hypothetical protein
MHLLKRRETMNNEFLCDRDGKKRLFLGLQAHNSSTGTFMLQKAIQAVKLYGGNVIEVPVYWYAVEPTEGKYDTQSVKDLILQVRDAGLKLIILWFGSSKNGHPNYAPEYVKLNPYKYRLALRADGAPVPSMSPHCRETLEADKQAFIQVINCIKEVDSDFGTVVAVQVENEIGLANTDRCYSKSAQKDYEYPVPEELASVCLDDMGERDGTNTWRGKFGRHAHEAFTAWYFARFVDEIAAAGKAVYNIPMTVNIMLGEQGVEEAGFSYNSGAAVGRVMDIWKIGAPNIDIICPDIYIANRNSYTRVCDIYSREDNPLFIAETFTVGEHISINAMRAIADYGAVGFCGFGAESALDNSGSLLPNAEKLAITMRAIAALEPLIIRYHRTGNIHALIQEEFSSEQYVKLENYHVLAKFSSAEGSRPFWVGSNINLRNPENTHILKERGRALLIQTGEHEFFLAGAGVQVEFLRRPPANDMNPFVHLTSRQSGQLNFLTVEEGHFENENWVCDYMRNGDEANGAVYVHPGQVVRIRLNPNIGMDI